MSTSFRQLESLRKILSPGSKWRNRKFPDRIATVLEVGMTTRGLKPMIVFQYGWNQNLVWVCEPEEWFCVYEESFELLGGIRPNQNE